MAKRGGGEEVKKLTLNKIISDYPKFSEDNTHGYRVKGNCWEGNNKLCRMLQKAFELTVLGMKFEC